VQLPRSLAPWCTLQRGAVPSHSLLRAVHARFHLCNEGLVCSVTLDVEAERTSPLHIKWWCTHHTERVAHARKGQHSTPLQRAPRGGAAAHTGLRHSQACSCGRLATGQDGRVFHTMPWPREAGDTRLLPRSAQCTSVFWPLRGRLSRTLGCWRLCGQVCPIIQPCALLLPPRK